MAKFFSPEKKEARKAARAATPLIQKGVKFMQKAVPLAALSAASVLFPGAAAAAGKAAVKVGAKIVSNPLTAVKTIAGAGLLVGAGVPAITKGTKSVFDTAKTGGEILAGKTTIEEELGKRDKDLSLKDGLKTAGLIGAGAAGVVLLTEGIKGIDGQKVKEIKESAATLPPMTSQNLQTPTSSPVIKEGEPVVPQETKGGMPNINIKINNKHKFNIAIAQ